MMIHINRLILFLSISFILPTSVFAMDMATQPTSGVFKFQHKLASNGNARAQYKLGSMYESGTGVDLDIEKAKHWYGLSSTAGVKSANDRLTYLSVKERGYDPAKNSVWLDGVKKSANKSNGDAMFLLAQLYREGFGVDKDLGKALEILDRVSLLGAADVEDERALIQAEMIASKKAEKAAQRKNEIDAARLAKQKIDQRANKEQQIVQQEAAAKTSQDEKIKRYEKAMMQLLLEQQQIDKQQAWASGGGVATADDEI